MKNSRFIVFAAAAMLTTAAIFSSAEIVTFAQSCLRDVITEEDIVRQVEGTPPTNEWVLYTKTPASQGTFVVGPETPPSGVGSLRFVTPTSGDKVFLFNYEQIGTDLADIDRLGYSTYRDSGAQPNQVPAINIQINPNEPNSGTFATLVFEPVYNTGQGAIVDGEWQTWDAYQGGNAIWWSTRDLRDADGDLIACNPNGPLANTPDCAGKLFVPWSTIVAGLPDAEISGGFGVNQGSGNPALTAFVDALKIGSGSDCVTFDFEPYEVPATGDQCKNGGWQTLRRANGSTFKNQGDCIQYVNTGK